MAMQFFSDLHKIFAEPKEKEKKRLALVAVLQIKPDFAFKAHPPASTTSQLPAGILDFLSASIRVLVFASYLWNPLLNREIKRGSGWDAASVLRSAPWD